MAADTNPSTLAVLLERTIVEKARLALNLHKYQVQVYSRRVDRYFLTNSSQEAVHPRRMPGRTGTAGLVRRLDRYERTVLDLRRFRLQGKRVFHHRTERRRRSHSPSRRRQGDTIRRFHIGTKSTEVGFNLRRYCELDNEPSYISLNADIET